MNSWKMTQAFNSKFIKTSEEIELLDRSYSVSDIQDYLENILKKDMNYRLIILQ